MEIDNNYLLQVIHKYVTPTCIHIHDTPTRETRKCALFMLEWIFHLIPAAHKLSVRKYKHNFPTTSRNLRWIQYTMRKRIKYLLFAPPAKTQRYNPVHTDLLTSKQSNSDWNEMREPKGRKKVPEEWKDTKNYGWKGLSPVKWPWV